MDANLKLIEGVKFIPHKVFKDDRGSLFHVLRSDADYFDSFGEVYVSHTKANTIKGWKKHLEMTQNLSVIQGKVLFVIYDDRSESQTYGLINQFIMSPNDNYGLLIIPNNLWYSFKSISDCDTLIVNCSTIFFRENECVNLSLADAKNIPYSWEL
jgi:dTDP-4-dehydrorhamnose 3,5-epimerase